MRTCAKCGRTVGKSALRCLYCGAVPAEPPAPAAPARKPVLVTCPGCLRTARIAPGAGGACAFCALAFDVDDDGTARLGRTRATPAASRADVDRLVASLPPARLWDAVRDVLLRRAAFGELGAGEAERAIDGLTLIATWPATSPQWLPLSVADAVNVVPRVIYGVIDGGLAHEEGHTVLLSTVGSAARRRDHVGRAATGLVDLGVGLGISAGITAVTSAVGLGVGVRVERDQELETESRHQLRAYLVPRHGGVELAGVLNQVDQQAPYPLSVAQERELHRRIAGSRTFLAAYYILGAVFGPTCRIGTVFSLTRDAIARRLSALGCDSSPELVDQLCVRMPPVFGSQAVHSPR